MVLDLHSEEHFTKMAWLWSHRKNEWKLKVLNTSERNMPSFWRHTRRNCRFSCHCPRLTNAEQNAMTNGMIAKYNTSCLSVIGPLRCTTVYFKNTHAVCVPKKKLSYSYLKQDGVFPFRDPPCRSTSWRTLICEDEQRSAATCLRIRARIMKTTG